MTLPQQGNSALAPVVTGSDHTGYSVRPEMVRLVQLTPVVADQVPEGAKSALRRYLAEQAARPLPIGAPWWETDPEGDWCEVSGHSGLRRGWAAFARATA